MQPGGEVAASPPGLTTETLGRFQMAKHNPAPIVTLVQPSIKPAPKTGAERAREYRKRLKEKGVVTSRITSPVTAVTSRRTAASYMLVTAAFALATVGVTMNGWFARSLGSSDISGWLFLAIGVAADMVALAVPSCAATLWATRRRSIAAAGWLVWAMTFCFAVTAGIGFASVNIADVTMARASRITPAVTAANAALADAKAARDRECKGGVGRFCRDRESAVVERQAAVDAAARTVAETGDPQTLAAVHIVAWISGGMIRPAPEDFAMLRLVLLALLPQIGGILLMIGRAK